MIRRSKHITRSMLAAEPNSLFLFGDNFRRRGHGGQAREMRGMPNAVGLPTKHGPGRAPGDYLDDDDYELFMSEAIPVVNKLRDHLEAGGIVVIPADGVGTGLASLPRKAPRIWRVLSAMILDLEETWGVAP